MNPAWKAAIGVILVFILGWFGGAMGTLLIIHHRMVSLAPRSTEQMAFLLERQTTRNLGLNASQKKQIHALFVENLRERLQVQKEIQPQIHAVNGQTLQQIDALLTPAQQQKLQDNLDLFKERFGRNPLSTGPVAASPGGAPAPPATNAAVGNPPPH